MVEGCQFLKDALKYLTILTFAMLYKKLTLNFNNMESICYTKKIKRFIENLAKFSGQVSIRLFSNILWATANGNSKRIQVIV